MQNLIDLKIPTYKHVLWMPRPETEIFDVDGSRVCFAECSTMEVVKTLLIYRDDDGHIGCSPDTTMGVRRPDGTGYIIDRGIKLELQPA